MLTDDELTNQSPVWNGKTYYPNNLQSANENIKQTCGIPSTYNNTVPYQSYIDLQPIRNTYIYISIHQLEIIIH